MSKGQILIFAIWLESYNLLFTDQRLFFTCICHWMCGLYAYVYPSWFQKLIYTVVPCTSLGKDIKICLFLSIIHSFLTWFQWKATPLEQGVLMDLFCIIGLRNQLTVYELQLIRLSLMNNQRAWLSLRWHQCKSSHVGGV